MVIYLSGEVTGKTNLDELSPRQIVTELDKYVIGQQNAKRAVAIALRNRVRRQKLPPDLAQDVMPKNIIMIGATGVGKTEIARRLARLSGSPFIKVEASKFTEVGYVGRDVESIIRDLVELAIDLVREEKQKEVQEKARFNAEERILELLLPNNTDDEDESSVLQDQFQRTREKLRQQLRDGRLNSRVVEMDVREKSLPAGIEVITPQGMEEMDLNLKDILPGLFNNGRTKKRKMRVDEAMEYLLSEEEQKLIDMDQVSRIALDRVSDSGIVFIDEIDKIAGREGLHGPDISREGVQRDLLPIIEGTTVNTRYGMVRTDHILFIAAGAFHVSKPSDLIPELQGRFPIRVSLDPLSKDDFKRILTEPKNSLIRQYTALMATEGIQLEFPSEGIEVIADFAYAVNQATENIGARRLHTVMEKLLEEISFEGTDLAEKSQVIDAQYVQKMLATIVENNDLSRYIL
jgi:ATP-dependent HslUV protease ATP-binding subunit HslU